jgi:beta-dihydromenaquinone-9 omega-hydroxylase
MHWPDSCPGTPLARMEGLAVLRKIVTNIDRIEVVESPTWTTNDNLRDLPRLRVAVMPPATAQSLSPLR